MSGGWWALHALGDVLISRLSLQGTILTKLVTFANRAKPTNYDNVTDPNEEGNNVDDYTLDWSKE